VTSATRRLQLFTGKGGVGKSSVVAATAIAAARAGRRPLVVELGHRATMATVFGGTIGHGPSEVAPGVHAANIDFDEALIDYVAEHARVRALAKRIVRGDALRRFFHAAPAVSEVVTLRMLERLEEATERGTPRWDPILVDLDATGHALMFLSLPEVFADLATKGPLARLLQGFTALLSDRERTALNLVTLPDELPAQETRELYGALRRKGLVPLGRLFINRVPQQPVSEATRALYGRLAEAGWDAEVALAHRLEAIHERSTAIADALEKELALPTLRLPALAPFDLETLTTHLEAAS
jgi:arsenite-transporting ATPase